MSIGSKLKEYLLRKLVYKSDIAYSLNQKYGGEEFKQLLEKIKDEVESFSHVKKSEMIFIMDRYLDILKKDIEYTCIASTINSNNKPLWEILRVPDAFVDKDGVIRNTISRDNVIEINLDEKCTLTKPWSMGKYITNINEKLTFEKEFIYDKNHKVYYYPNLDIAIVISGYHSIANALMYHKTIAVNAWQVNDESLLENIYTDGIYWRSLHNDDKLCFDHVHHKYMVIDNLISFKFAIIFTLAQWKHDLLNDRRINYRYAQKNEVVY